MTTRLGMTAVVALGLALPARADYTAIDLNAYAIQPAAVNSSRQFAGTDTRPPAQAYRFDTATGFTYLGTLGGATSAATAISESGYVAGFSRVSPGGSLSHAFLWRPGIGLTDLGTLGGTTLPTVSAVNSVGWVVGASPLPGNAQTRAFLWRPDTGTMQNLGSLGGNSTARDVNDAGVVVGNSFVSNTGPLRPFVWTEATGLQPLGPTSGFGAFGSANAVNDAGMIAGGSPRTDGTTGAFVYEGGAFTDLGGLGGDYSEAFGINNQGLVVGAARTDAGESRAFVWDATNGLRDLNALLTNGSDVTLTRALAVTDRGDILAQQDTIDGTITYLVTTDGDLDQPAVLPAPPAAVLFVLALPLAGLLRRRAM